MSDMEFPFIVLGGSSVPATLGCRSAVRLTEVAVGLGC
jgi:hypothetical protein